MMRRLLPFLAAACLAAPAVAQSPLLEQAMAAGQVGERFDGYLGVVGAAPPPVQRQVRAINIQRRNLYIQLAERRNVSPDVVGMATGCQLLTQLSAGEAYLLQDGRWRRRAPGQSIPVPDYCR
jgi:uncharacterized protein YdbL (DUF1318 family)